MKLTNSLLAIIAACLIYQVVQPLIQRLISVGNEATGPSPVASKVTDVNIVGVSTDLPVLVQNQKADIDYKSPLDVMVVGATAELPVHVENQNVKDIQDVRIVGTANNLPVAIQNSFRINEPLKVDISSIGGNALGGTVLPVIVGNTVETDITGLNGGHLAHVPNVGDAFPVAIYSH